MQIELIQHHDQVWEEERRKIVYRPKETVYRKIGIALSNRIEVPQIIPRRKMEEFERKGWLRNLENYAKSIDKFDSSKIDEFNWKESIFLKNLVEKKIFATMDDAEKFMEEKKDMIEEGIKLTKSALEKN